MNKRGIHSILLLCLTLFGFIGLTLTNDAYAKHAQPNIIIIFTDDQGWADIGVHNADKDVKTPFIDQMANNGVSFRHAYVTAPQCMPSRAGLMTGRYQNRFGFEQNLDGPLPLDQPTLAERLQTAGYTTGLAGKWHLERILARAWSRQQKNALMEKFPGDAQRYAPGGRGFDEYLFGNMNSYQATHTSDGKPLAKNTSLRDERYRIDVKSDWALSFIDRHAKDNKPFFLYLSYYAPHVPSQSTTKYLQRFDKVPDTTRRTGLAMIAAIDDGVGQIRDRLRKHKIEKNTLLFFISDNGAPLGEKWNGSLNTPLAGEKGDLLDGGIRVPFLMEWPGTLRAGQILDQPVISLDVATTIFPLAGIETNDALDGEDLIPYVLGKQHQLSDRPLFWRWRDQAAVRQGDWKYIHYADGTRQLFNLRNETSEAANLINSHQHIAKKLAKQLDKWTTELVPPGLP